MFYANSLNKKMFSELSYKFKARNSTYFIDVYTLCNRSEKYDPDKEEYTIPPYIPRYIFG